MARINRKRWVVGQYIQTVGRVNEGGKGGERKKKEKHRNRTMCVFVSGELICAMPTKIYSVR